MTAITCCPEHAAEDSASAPTWVQSNLKKILRLEACQKRLRAEKEDLVEEVKELREQARSLSGAMTLPLCPSRKEALPGLPVLLENSMPAEEGWPGVYFLINQGHVVYVGQSTNMLYRFTQHLVSRGRGEKVFDRVAFLPVEKRGLDLVEAYYINEFAPEYNRRRPSVVEASILYERGLSPG